MRRGIELLLFSVLLIGIVSAGCCFDPSSGVCSENADSLACVDGGGEYSSSGCSSISECLKGCCVLGGAVGFMNQYQCGVAASAQGHVEDFRTISEAECLSLSLSQVRGACVLEEEFASECFYVSSDQCVGASFYPNTFCSDASLEVDCTKTTETVCGEDGNVHYLDDCGNLDEVKEGCDYEQGTICAVGGEGDAFCRDLNCVSAGKKNGDRWCVDTDGVGHQSDISSFIPVEMTNSVGSEFYVQSCVDGQIYTERCGEYRSEVCSGGKCVPNPWRNV